MIASEDVPLNGDVAELACSVEALDVACRTDVDAPAVVEQLVTADEDIAHEVVTIEAGSSIAVGQVVEDADMSGSLNAYAMVAAVPDDVTSNDLSFSFGHRLTSVYSVSEARLVFYEDAIVATIHADTVCYDEVLVIVATKSDADAATATFSFRP